MSKFDAVRNRLMKDCKVLFEGLDYEVLRTGTQELCLPIIGDDNEDGYLVITFKIPKGSRDGDLYDGYAVAEEYRMKVEAKTEKAKKSAEAKARKIERDKAAREARAKAKAERQGKTE